MRQPPISRRADVPVALLVMLVHVVGVAGYTGAFTGDFGRWAHEVERFANGELPYRDFQWHFPPLGMWVVGGAARVVGTDLAPLAWVTGTLALLLTLPFVRLARLALNRADAVVVGACLVLALAYAQTLGAPIALGYYTPAAPVGALCLLVAAWCFAEGERETENKTDADALSGGLHASTGWMACCAALAVLSKQDFWFPALYLVLARAIRSRTVRPLLVFGLVIAIGIAIIAVTAGISVLRPLASGFGHVAMTGGGGFPSWERVTIDLLALTLSALVVALLVSGARRRLQWGAIVTGSLIAVFLATVHVTMTMATAPVTPGGLRTPAQDALQHHLAAGAPMLRPALGWLKMRILQTPLAVALAPALLLLLALRWRTLAAPRRVRVALLLGLAVTLRVRRAFGGSDWVEFLVTVPAAIAALELLLPMGEPETRRFRRLVAAALVCAAAYAHVTLGRGWGTQRSFPALRTQRGTVQWPANKVRDYEVMLAALDRVDPARERPLVAFGYTGGWNYFMRRRNPFPTTQDFYFSAFDADSLVAHRPRRLLLIDSRFGAEQGWGEASFSWTTWDQRYIRAPYDWFDRPRFDRLRDGCTPVAIPELAYRLLDCP